MAQIKQNVALDDPEGGVVTNGVVRTKDDGMSGHPLEWNGDIRRSYVLFSHTEKWGLTVFEVQHDRVRVYPGTSYGDKYSRALLDGELIFAVDNKYQVELCFETNGRQYRVSVLKELFFPGELGSEKPLEMVLVRNGFTIMPPEDAYIPA